MAARRFLRLAACVAAPAALFAAAAAAAAPASAALAARIDGEPVYAATVDTLWQQRRASQPTLTRRAVLDEVIEVRLLSARANVAAPKTPGTTVAFAPEVVVEERLVAALHEAYGKDIEAAIKRQDAAPGFAGARV